MKTLAIVVALAGAGAFLFMSCEGLKIVAPPATTAGAANDGGSGYAPEAGGEAVGPDSAHEDAPGL